MSYFKQGVHKVAAFIRGISCLYVFYNYGGFISKVDGPSMFPTFTGRGDWVVAEALPGLCDRVKVGDVVISTRPIAADENIIKRITAMEGQSVVFFKPGDAAPVPVKVVAGRGSTLAWLCDRPSYAAIIVAQVPRGHVWLQGDNLTCSRDSREYGPVPLALLKGRVVAQLYPNLKLVGRTM